MANITDTEPRRGRLPSTSVTTEWVRDATEVWVAALADANPLLNADSVHAAVAVWTEDLLVALTQDPFDPALGAEIGARLEALESFQPGDLQRVQEALLPVLVSPLDAEARDRAAVLLFALGAGFFAAKARRASQFDMSAESRMSHDLKTPINAITGFSRVILKGIDGPITDFQREDLTSIYEAGQKLLTMINDVFSVRKRDAARTLIHEQPYLVAELLADIARTAQPLASERDHTFELRMEGYLGMMALDASMVRWILLSLLSHAIRQASRGLISVSAARDKSGEETEVLLFTVSYRLPESLRAYADFPSPPQTDGAASPEWPGDIGLVTCRHFCEQLGGTVELVTGETVAFQVRLPAVPITDLH